MKEMLTKKFWQGVMNTFHEALEDPSLKTSNSNAVAEVKPNGSPADAPSSPEPADGVDR